MIPRVSRPYCLQTGSLEETADSEVSRYFKSCLLKQCSELLSLRPVLFQVAPGAVAPQALSLTPAPGSTKPLDPHVLCPSFPSALFSTQHLPLLLPSQLRTLLALPVSLCSFQFGPGLVGRQEESHSALPLHSPIFFSLHCISQIPFPCFICIPHPPQYLSLEMFPYFPPFSPLDLSRRIQNFINYFLIE